MDNRLASSVETALRLSEGLLHVELVEVPEGSEKKNFKNGDVISFSEKFSCPESGFSIDEIEPRLFSFNSPYGACEACNGLGTEYYFDEKLIVPNDELSIEEGAIAPWHQMQNKHYSQVLEALSEHYDFSLETPYYKLSDKIKQGLMYGSGDTEIEFKFHDGLRMQSVNKHLKA